MHGARGEKARGLAHRYIPALQGFPHSQAASPALPTAARLSSLFSSFCSKPPLIGLLLLFSHSCLGPILILTGSPPIEYPFVSSPFIELAVAGRLWKSGLWGLTNHPGPIPRSGPFSNALKAQRGGLPILFLLSVVLFPL